MLTHCVVLNLIIKRTTLIQFFDNLRIDLSMLYAHD